MTDCNDMANAPLEVTLGGRTIKVRRLSVGELFGQAEARVVSQHLARSREMATAFDGKERVAFVERQMQRVPTGEELQKAVEAYLNSWRGMVACLWLAARDDQPGLTETELGSLIGQSKNGDLGVIVDYLAGLEKKAPKALKPTASGKA